MTIEMIGEIQIMRNPNNELWHAGEPLRTSYASHELALHAAMEHQFPLQYDAAIKAGQKWPALAKRALAGLELLVTGHVTILPVRSSNSVIARVQSSTNQRSYAIRSQLGDAQLSCECTDFSSRHSPEGPGGFRYCKHILATRIALFTEWSATAAPKQIPAGNHNGRIVTRVNGNGRQASTDPHIYGNGEAVDESDIGNTQLHIDHIGQNAYNHEGLMGWIYRN